MPVFLEPAHHAVVGNIAPHQKAAVPEIHRPLGPAEAGGDPLDRRIADLVLELLVERLDPRVGIAPIGQVPEGQFVRLGRIGRDRSHRGSGGGSQECPSFHDNLLPRPGSRIRRHLPKECAGTVGGRARVTQACRSRLAARVFLVGSPAEARAFPVPRHPAELVYASPFPGPTASSGNHFMQRRTLRLAVKLRASFARRCRHACPAFMRTSGEFATNLSRGRRCPMRAGSLRPVRFTALRRTRSSRGSRC